MNVAIRGTALKISTFPMPKVTTIPPLTLFWTTAEYRSADSTITASAILNIIPPTEKYWNIQILTAHKVYQILEMTV